MKVSAKILFKATPPAAGSEGAQWNIFSQPFEEFVPGSIYLITPMGGDLDDGTPIPAAFCECLGDVRPCLRSLIEEEAQKYDDKTLRSGMALWAAAFVVTGQYATAFRVYLPVEIPADQEDPSLFIAAKDYIGSVIDMAVDEALVFAVREIRRPEG